MVAHWSAKLAQCQIGIERRNADPNDLTSSDFDGPEHANSIEATSAIRAFRI